MDELIDISPPETQLKKSIKALSLDVPGDIIDIIISNTLNEVQYYMEHKAKQIHHAITENFQCFDRTNFSRKICREITKKTKAEKTKRSIAI